MDWDSVHHTLSRFHRLHKYVYAIIGVYCLVCFLNLDEFTYNKSKYIFYILIMFLFLMFEYLFSLSKQYDQSKYLCIKIHKYAQYVYSLVFFFMSQNRYDFGISIILSSLFVLEIIFVFDFMEGFNRYVCYITVILPVIIITVCLSLVDWIENYSFFKYGCIVTIFSFLFIGIGEELSIFYKDSKEKVFVQQRLVLKMNDANEELKQQQEKVKKTNELLGVQKVKLQAAYKRINVAHAEMVIQNEIVTSISASLEIHKLMTLICDLLLQKSGVDVVAVIVEENKFMYDLKTNFGLEYEKQFAKAIETGKVKMIVENNQTYVDNFVGKDKYLFSEKEKLGSFIVVPLIQNNNRIGLLFAGHSKENYFKENKAFFETIVVQLLVGINNANLYSQMEEMAIRDGLTGIYNRRHLTDLFNNMLAASIANKSPLSLALFDIDKFKIVNDTYGHLFGDIVIKAVAALAEKVATANGGIAGRYGGEEFVIIFPEKDLKETHELVKAVHQSVKELKLEHNGDQVQVRVSIGVTSYPETCKNPADLLNRADWAMYHSKQNGRDRITIDNESIRQEI